MTWPWELRIEGSAPASRKVHGEALSVLAGGVAHEVRHVPPFPIAIERASGPRKWDVDGNEYIDYLMGHGALLLGHGHPEVTEAVREQVVRGTHYGASHRSEVEWAQLICELVPSAERVRFTSSGTEAVMLAARVARSVTGRDVIVKFDYHFHGWSEIGMVALNGPSDLRPPGLSTAALSDVVALSPRQPQALESRLAAGDVAAIIVEPSGAHFGQVPVDRAFLENLRTQSSRYGSLLIFDEVVTGFRWAPGGAQERFGIAPDLTAMAKIVAGGLPGGAVAGLAEVMSVFEDRTEPSWNRDHRLFHPGTFNANPLSAAAGGATLRLVANGEPTKRADQAAAQLRSAMNDVLEGASVPGKVYGDSSAFHVYLGEEPAGDERDHGYAAMRGGVGLALRVALLSRGVDLLGSGGLVSATHGPAEIEATVAAFDQSVRELARAGVTAA